MEDFYNYKGFIIQQLGNGGWIAENEIRKSFFRKINIKVFTKDYKELKYYIQNFSQYFDK